LFCREREKTAKNQKLSKKTKKSKMATTKIVGDYVRISIYEQPSLHALNYYFQQQQQTKKGI
jgi:hypothetical protein